MSMTEGKYVDPNCLSSFSMPWLLNRELIINGRQVVMVNAFKLAKASKTFWDLLARVGRDGKLIFYCDDAIELETILQYSHTGSISINSSSVEAVINLAKRYGVDTLLQLCEQFILSNLKNDTFWNIWNLCKRLTPYSSDTVYLYMLENFSEICMSSEFLQLDYKEIQRLLNDDRINVKDEMTLFDALLLWVRHSPSDRERYILPLANCLRLARLSLSQINAIENNTYVKHLPLKDRDMIMSVKRHILRSKRGMRVLPEARHLIRPRLPHDCILVFGGGMFCSPYRKVKVYNSRDDTWSILPRASNIPTGRVFFESVVLDNYIYMLGGLCERFMPTPSVFKLCFKTLQWFASAPMQESRFFFASAKLQGHVYAMGGHREGWETIASVERYSPHLNRWEHVAPLLVKRNRATAVTFGDRIYICGGNSGDYGAVMTQWTSTCEVYNPESNQWSYISSMPDDTWGWYKAVAMNSTIYLIQTRRVLICNLLTNKWSVASIDHMPEQYSFSVTEMDGEIHRFSDSSVDKWRPGDNHWKLVQQPAFQPGWGHQSIVIRGVDLVYFVLSKSTQVFNYYPKG